jgi:hypothetical protein
MSPNEQPETSDLAGAGIAAWVIGWVLAICVAFFFIGAVVGIIVVAVAVIASGFLAIRAVGRADES